MTSTTAPTVRDLSNAARRLEDRIFDGGFQRDSFLDRCATQRVEQYGSSPEGYDTDLLIEERRVRVRLTTGLAKDDMFAETETFAHRDENDPALWTVKGTRLKAVGATEADFEAIQKLLAAALEVEAILADFPS